MENKTFDDLKNMSNSDFMDKFQDAEDKRQAVLEFLCGDNSMNPADIVFILSSALGKMVQSIAISRGWYDKWLGEDVRTANAKDIFDTYMNASLKVLKAFRNDMCDALKDGNIEFLSGLIDDAKIK